MLQQVFRSISNLFFIHDPKSQWEQPMVLASKLYKLCQCSPSPFPTIECPMTKRLDFFHDFPQPSPDPILAMISPILCSMWLCLFFIVFIAFSPHYCNWNFLLTSFIIDSLLKESLYLYHNSSWQGVYHSIGIYWIIVNCWRGQMWLAEPLNLLHFPEFYLASLSFSLSSLLTVSIVPVHSHLLKIQSF